MKIHYLTYICKFHGIIFFLLCLTVSSTAQQSNTPSENSVNKTQNKQEKPKNLANKNANVSGNTKRVREQDKKGERKIKQEKENQKSVKVDNEKTVSNNTSNIDPNKTSQKNLEAENKDIGENTLDSRTTDNLSEIITPKSEQQKYDGFIKNNSPIIIPILILTNILTLCILLYTLRHSLKSTFDKYVGKYLPSKYIKTNKNDQSNAESGNFDNDVKLKTVESEKEIINVFTNETNETTALNSSNSIDNRKTDSSTISSGSDLEKTNVLGKITNKDKARVPYPYKSLTNIIQDEKWLVVGASIPGKDHIERQIPKPCQDSHILAVMENGWGIAVVCDGAGSADLSDIGSKIVADIAAKTFQRHVELKSWTFADKLPDLEIWHETSKTAFQQIRHYLENYALKHNYSVSELACTVIVIVYSPLGILVTHIGDGRAGYCNSENQWHPLIEPWKGEEANHTVFLTSVSFPDDKENYIRSHVINERFIAFTALTDGCEMSAFECGTFYEESQEFIPKNIPSSKFYNPLIAKMRKFNGQENSVTIKEKWENFIKRGTKRLQDEPDDKTMVLGILLDKKMQ
jgi:hypothetical protein